ncbi:hypothetical protein EYF80_043968 [Liparis tanakae]|uniref:Secreted protein n=1 Tax=Liparis tanakae TaxID=230148 RepID=A0A4Z2FYR0_9TELE|nr:hypothetical protein EYF80_043968 [Liparis tanakae]
MWLPFDLGLPFALRLPFALGLSFDLRLPFDLGLPFALGKGLRGVAQQVVRSLLVAHDVHQLQVLRGEQQAVEVEQVDVAALVALQSVQQGGDDRPLLLNPGHEKRRRRRIGNNNYLFLAVSDLTRRLEVVSVVSDK